MWSLPRAGHATRRPRTTGKGGVTGEAAVRSQARIAYNAYVGHLQLRRSLPDDEVLGDPSRHDLAQVLAVLSPPV